MGWFSKLKTNIAEIFTKKKLDDKMLDELRTQLILADVGKETAEDLVKKLKKDRFEKEVDEKEVRAFLANGIEEQLKTLEGTLTLPAETPAVLLFIGVNGSGKTTSIAKIAALLKKQGKKVMIVAGDTFRAAAIEQLSVWADRAGVEVISKPVGSDAAGLVYDAYNIAKSKAADVLLVDTAGRLQNRDDLMAELQKILKVMKKVAPHAPHETFLVLDATVGQNAHSQVSLFKEKMNVSGLIINKLDGTAKAGVLIALAKEHKLPVTFIGVGEQMGDLQPFSAKEYSRNLMGL